jgi:aspartyl-tRNA(Asn)/glutamyl-tRNA(Gln) amidotransferase subunit A
MKYYNMTISELGKLLRDKEISTLELLDSVNGRIDEVESKVESYITISREYAKEQALVIQKKINNGEVISPISGIPMGLKDIICTKDILTTCGSKMLNNFVPQYNATVTEKLYKSGAVMLGKLNMDEFGMGSTTENSYYKVTKNPWDLERVAGGSSGGSAAAVAAGEAIYSLGSDTGGSIRQPASFCGIVGIRPTYGAVSRFGLVAYASSLDQIGAFTKDVRDCAMVLNEIVGVDEKDSTSVKYDYKDFTEVLTGDIKGMKIGLPKEYFGDGLSPDVKEAVLRAAKKYEELGAKIVDISLPLIEYAIPSYYIIACAEASSNLARFDGVKYGYRAKDYDSLMDMYCNTRNEGFGKEVKRRILLGTFVLSSGYYDAYYKKAQQVRTLIRKQFNDALSLCDVILCPVSPSTAFKLGEMTKDPLKMYLEDIYTVSLNIAGLPGMSVPCGVDKAGMPIGMQLIGKAFDEATMLKVAYAFEQNTEYHKMKPKL